MQVKKFEAKTMQEALQMVKQELGPEAIILSARDNKKGFGLLDSGSVEVTAAVSHKTLQERRVAESKIRPALIDKFRNSPASVQKKFIQESQGPRAQAAPQSRRSRQYVDIVDDEAQQPEAMAETRIKSAVQRAWDAMNLPQGQAAANYPVVKNSAPVAVPPAAPVVDTQQIQISNLEQEIRQLKQILGQFQDLPQLIQKSTYPGSELGLRFELSGAFQKLIKAGIDEEAARELLASAQDDLGPQLLKKSAYVEAWLVKKMMDEVKVVNEPSAGWIHCFVGPPGSGKTSALVKFASDLILNQKKRIAILTCDSQKVGAIEQMRIFTQILNVPFGTISPNVDWMSLRGKLRDYDHVLVDFPGLKLADESEERFLQQMLPPSELRTVHFVASLASKDHALREFARRYQAVNYDDGIFTNLDEAFHYGFLYSFARQYRTPLHSFGLGAGIPEDFEYATRERVIDLIFEISKRQPRERVVDGGMNG